MLKVIGFTLCCLFFTVSKAEHHWGYLHHNGPNLWCNIANKTCCGNAQSPIDIKGSIKQVSGRPVHFQGYTKKYDWTVQNNGHSIQIRINNTGELPTILGGPLKSNYTFSNVHFHFPSEHKLFSKLYDGEIHMVHFKTSAGNLDNALKLDDGIAVVGFLIKIQPGGHFLDRFMENILGGVLSKDATTMDYKDAVLQHLALVPRMTDKCYYSYHGSLTTPNCNEDVTWLFHRHPVFISKKTIDDLKAYIRTTDDNRDISLFPNNRPVLPQNGRLIQAFNCKLTAVY